MADDKQPIDAEIVEKPATLKVAGHVFTPVIFGTGTLHRLSQREEKFINRFLATGGSLELACIEIGVDKEAGKRYLKRPAIKKYVEDMLTRAARANGLTMNKLLEKIDGVIEGTLAMTKEQLEGIKIAARILRPSGINVTLNQQNNNFGGASAAPNPYEKLSSPELAAETLKRIGHGGAPA